MRFIVTITETLEKTVEITADSLDEAEKMISEKWKNGDYILDSGDFIGVEFSAEESENCYES